MDWHAYITESPFEAFQNSSDYAEYMAAIDALQKIHSFQHGDLRYKNVPKVIIKERTQAVAVKKGHPPYCFRFQCMVTGRQSAFIKETEYHQVGITRKESENGGEYPSRLDVKDKFFKVKEHLSKMVDDIRENAFPNGSGGLWWSRYGEYLNSEEWFNLREKVLSRDGYQCRITGEKRNLQIHHLHYRDVGRESLDDLVTLCARAHREIHDRKRANVEVPA